MQLVEIRQNSLIFATKINEKHHKTTLQSRVRIADIWLWNIKFTGVSELSFYPVMLI